MKDKKLGELLPANESAKLSSKVHNLSYEDVHNLHSGPQKDPVKDGKLTDSEIKELHDLTLNRVNNGQSPFPWKSMELDDGNSKFW